MLYKTIYQSPLGPMSLVATQTHLIGAWFLGQKYFESMVDEEPIEGVNDILRQTVAWFDNYFSKNDQAMPDFLLFKGTPFQEKVWKILSTIPRGETFSYGYIGQLLDCKSGQAIGGAVGKNPFSIIIPCHRVVSKNGAMTGYAGGIEKKIWLLAHEKEK